MFPELNFVQTVAVWALPVLLAFTVHAIVTAQMAFRFGDHSGALRERLSLNPLMHADPVGTVVVPVLLISLGGFVIGWPKPVPVNPVAFRQPRKDLALLSVAAIGSNLAMAVGWALVLKLALATQSEQGVWLGIGYMARAGILINIAFTLFGLLPFPGFAGGHVVGALLPPAAALRWYRAQPWTLMALLLLMATGVLGAVLQGPYLWLQALVLTAVGFHG